MISLFQSSKSSSAGGELPLRALTLLVESLKQHALRAKTLNHAALFAAVDELLAVFSHKATEPQVLDAGKKSCSAVEQYFLALAKCIDSVGLDLATSIRALASLLHKSSGSQGDFLDKMEHIRDEFQVGHTIDDLVALRSHLDSCLRGLRNEISSARLAQKENQTDLMQHLSQLSRGVSTLRSTVPQVFSTGPAVSILRVRRIEAIRHRYGDHIAQRLVDHVIQILLVRWPVANDITPFTEECLAVVDSQNLDLDFHRNILRRLAGERIVLKINHEGRELTLPVAIDWTVIRGPADGDIRDFISNFLEGMIKQDAQVASLDQVLAS